LRQAAGIVAREYRPVTVARFGHIDQRDVALKDE
jgi:hypothetical protein